MRALVLADQFEVSSMEEPKLLFRQPFYHHHSVDRPSDRSEQLAQLDVHGQRVVVLRALTC